ncbi:MAG: hypothetical protein LH469_03810 [Frankiaceae bacterium]|nr:hypothetical protein [Frankiaceae bacterium]
MSRPERLLLLAFFAVVLVLVGLGEPTSTAVGAVAGAVPGVLASSRLRRLSGRMDATLGIVEPVPRGVRPRALAVRAGLHLGVLGALLLSTLFIPFVGDELYAAAAAAVTGFAGALTAARLRR